MCFYVMKDVSDLNAWIHQGLIKRCCLANDESLCITPFSNVSWHGSPGEEKPFHSFPQKPIWHEK